MAQVFMWLSGAVDVPHRVLARGECACAPMPRATRAAFLANALVNTAWRNGPVENGHAGG